MDQAPEPTRILYRGDNLHILRTYLADESVDLIYLDPPFYSQRNYQAFFRQVLPAMHSQVRTQAFGDTWRWSSQVEHTYREVAARADQEVGRALEALRGLLGPGALLAYLVMMAERLVELRRV